MAGGRPLTPALLKELCVRLGGGERGEVEEDFPHWAVTALAVCRGRMPESTGALTRAVERLKPAHLAVAVLPTAELETADGSALHGGAQVWGIRFSTVLLKNLFSTAWHGRSAQSVQLGTPC